MSELGFQERSSARSGFRARDSSPDSVIFTLESNFSLFSSASASVDRCSFASDAHDRDSLASDVSLHLAAHETATGGNRNVSDLHESWSGPDRDPDQNKFITVYSNSNHAQPHTRLHKKGDKAKVHNPNSELSIEVEFDSHLTDSARSSFSLALKECQERRSTSEAIAKKLDRRRPASFDLNSAIAASSPRLGALRKSSISSRKSGTFPSPGTPNYRHSSVGMQKNWSSEGNRRQMNSVFLPLNNGRTLPSKWEDAERWIFSPVSGDGAPRTSLQLPQRRPKSKSGPLGPPGIAYYSLYYPAAQLYDGRHSTNFMAGSPFSAGVIAADGMAVRSSGTGAAFPVRTEPCMARSVSVHGFSEALALSSLPSQDEKVGGAADVSAAVSRRDMATQMSPEGSNRSTSSKRPSFSASTPSALTIVELQSVSSKSEMRDVEVDDKVTLTRWSKKHKAGHRKKSSEIVDDWTKKSVDARPGVSKSISRAKREDAKITAWENLQKAKAEAAIRKLEMKLEKKRSVSMDRIMNKLKSAQKKAQERRNSVLANQERQVSESSQKAIPFRGSRQIGSFSGCFTCHAF